jgi:hypothetical protein
MYLEPYLTVMMQSCQAPDAQAARNMYQCYKDCYTQTFTNLGLLMQDEQTEPIITSKGSGSGTKNVVHVVLRTWWPSYRIAVGFYDLDAKRYVIMWISVIGDTSRTSAEPRIFAFISTSNDPVGSWQVKALPVNPPPGTTAHVDNPRTGNTLLDYPQVRYGTSKHMQFVSPGGVSAGNNYCPASLGGTR